MLAANFTLPWWRQTTVADYQAFIVACQGQRDHPCMREFAEQHAVVNVFVSNKMEGTLPSGSEDLDTYDLVKKEMGLTGKDYLPQTPVTWHAEGSVEGNTDKRQSAKAQLTQHARALRYLAEQQQLTATSLKEAHKILVHGAQEGGAPTLAGAYRQTPAHSGTRFEYPAPRFIEAMVEEVLSSFHSNLERARAGNLDTNTMAAKLFYDMVTLHPFENGNGRLCRLLVSYALRAAGEPFLLCMSNGQGRSQQHYHQVLRWADQHNGNTTRLAAYILKCHHFVWQSFSRSLESNEQGVAWDAEWIRGSYYPRRVGGEVQGWAGNQIT